MRAASDLKLEAVLDAARKHGLFVVHTLESHLPDLSDAPKNKIARCDKIGAVAWVQQRSREKIRVSSF